MKKSQHVFFRIVLPAVLCVLFGFLFWIVSKYLGYIEANPAFFLLR